MSTPVVLTVGGLSPFLEAELAPFRLVRASADLDWTAELAAQADAVRVIVTGGSRRLPPAWLDRFPGLELIAVHGVGTDGIDIPAMIARGVAVSNTPDVLTADVAELAIGLLLAVLRRIAANDRFVREGSWGGTRSPPLGSRLAGRRVGLLGAGRIGRAIARRLIPFDVGLFYASRGPHPDLPYPRERSAAELARAVDILIVSVSGGDETRGLVNAQVLQSLGPEGLLVNVARGSVVDEGGLLEALREKRIAGAGLDVFEDEPASAARFAGFDTVVLQPHQGSATAEARRAMAALVRANLDAWFAEGRLVTPVATAQD